MKKTASLIWPTFSKCAGQIAATAGKRNNIKITNYKYIHITSVIKNYSQFPRLLNLNKLKFLNKWLDNFKVIYLFIQ